MSKKFQVCHIRVPAKVYEAAGRVAEAEKRSINGQLNLWIERGMPAGLLDETRADLVAGGQK